MEGGNASAADDELPLPAPHPPAVHDMTQEAADPDMLSSLLIQRGLLPALSQALTSTLALTAQLLPLPSPLHLPSLLVLLQCQLLSGLGGLLLCHPEALLSSLCSPSPASPVPALLALHDLSPPPPHPPLPHNVQALLWHRSFLCLELLQQSLRLAHTLDPPLPDPDPPLASAPTPAPSSSFSLWGAAFGRAVTAPAPVSPAIDATRVQEAREAERARRVDCLTTMLTVLPSAVMRVHASFSLSVQDARVHTDEPLALVQAPSIVPTPPMTYDLWPWEEGPGCHGHVGSVGDSGDMKGPRNGGLGRKRRRPGSLPGDGGEEARGVGYNMTGARLPDHPWDFHTCASPAVLRGCSREAVTSTLLAELAGAFHVLECPDGRPKTRGEWTEACPYRCAAYLVGLIFVRFRALRQG